MEFPEPQPVGRRERSIAERHRMIVLLTSIFNLLPVGYVMGLLVAHPPLRLLLTLAVSFSFTYMLVQFLRRRFLTLSLTSELVVRRTLRDPARRTTEAAHALTTQGFASVATVVVATSSGVVLTRPIVVMARHADHQVASVNSVGVALITLLDDHTWLITSSSPVVTHPTLRVRRVVERDPVSVAAAHADGLRELTDQGVRPARQPDALDVVLHVELLEQDTLAVFRANGVSSPSAKALTAEARS